MTKFLVILPKSIAGSLIMKGLAQGLRACGICVYEKQVDNITVDELEKIKPTDILSYDYGFLGYKNLENYIKENLSNLNLIHYFADAPKSKFAYGENIDFYENLKQLNPIVFVWEKTYLKDFANTYFLPLAIVPSLYDVVFSGFKHYISFVGRPLSDKRQNILVNLSKIYKDKLAIYSYEAHFKQSVEDIKEKNLLNDIELEVYKKSYKGFLSDEKSMAKVYNASLINLNITEQGQDNLNYRLFEVMGSNGFLLTDNMPSISEFFKVGKELDVYNNEQDLVDKIDFYLKNREIAQKIALNGVIKIKTKHTFVDRARNILSVVYNK